MRRFPFGGYADRPYDQGLLENVDWAEILPRRVRPGELLLTQKHLNIEGIFGVRYSRDAYPRAVQWLDGQLYLEDGHHRVVLSAYKYPYAILKVRVWVPDPKITMGAVHKLHPTCQDLRAVGAEQGYWLCTDGCPDERQLVVNE